jgi:hypothetical protein
MFRRRGIHRRRDGVTVLFRTIAFGLMGGVFSVALTFLTVGFKHSTFDELLWVACLFVASSIASGCMYRANPESAWDLFTIWKKLIPAPKDVPKVLLVVCAMSLSSCGATKGEVAKEAPLTKNACEVLASSAYKASSSNDAGAAAIFRDVARRGGCF